MEDARTGPLISRSHASSSRKRRDRHHQQHGGGGGGGREFGDAATALETKSFGAGVGYGGGRLESKSRRQPPMQLESDNKTVRCSDRHHQTQQQQANTEGDFGDFMQYLGLAEGSIDSLRARRQRRANRTQSAAAEGAAELSGASGVKSANYQLSDRLASCGPEVGVGVGSQPRLPSAALSMLPLPTPPTTQHVQHQQMPHLQQQQQHQQHQQLQLTQYYQQQQLQQHHHHSQHHQQPFQHHLQQPPSDDFAEEESFLLLVDLMTVQAEKAGGGGGGGGGVRSHRWSAEAAVGALRCFSNEFSDFVYRFHVKSWDAFPFYQPEMLKMMALLSGSTYSATEADELLFTEQLRAIHLNMRLFLRPVETTAEVDDASLARLLVVYAEQLELSLRSMPSGASPDSVRYTRRCATALAAAVGRYARTAERRRQQVLGRMQGLAETVMGFVSRYPSGDGGGGGGGSGCGGGESACRKAIVDLFDGMLTCFTTLGSGGGGCSGGGSGGGAASVAEVATAADHMTRPHTGRRSRADSPARNSDDGGGGDTMSAASRVLPPPPASMLMAAAAAAASDNEIEAASVASDGGVGGGGDASEDDGCDAEACSTDAAVSVCGAAVEPLEALSLQLMERLEGLLSSVLPNERVNAQDYKASFTALYDWWRKVKVGCVSGGSGSCDKRITTRMTSINEQFDCMQRYRADTSGVKRLCSEAEMAWDLIEVAKLMLPGEKRTVTMMTAHTAPEWREATGTLVDATLATLYLYQIAQDASVLSTRLRTDLNRLLSRLTDCGPIPLLCLLRLRLMYLRARQYSDLLRAHPQGCLILELVQTHRALRHDDYPDGAGPLSLTVCVPVNDFRKFCQHIKDLRVLSFEARAPVTEKTSLLTKASCLKKIEKCCQCTIELQAPANASGSPGAAAGGGGGCGGTAMTVSLGGGASEDAMTTAGTSRRKLQLVVGGSRPSFGLLIRPDASHGRANAAMRMICDIVGPAGIGERVKYRGFHLAISMPHNYRPLTVFADTSRPLTC